MPASGLSRFRSGVSALPEKRSPPIRTGPMKPASRHRPIIGSTTHSSCSNSAPTWPNNWSGCLNSWGSGLSAIFIQPSEPRASGADIVSRATTPAPNTAAVASSRERGMLPCSRASRRRFSLGCSVRSPLSSCSDMGMCHGSLTVFVQVLFQSGDGNRAVGAWRLHSETRPPTGGVPERGLFVAMLVFGVSR